MEVTIQKNEKTVTALLNGWLDSLGTPEAEHVLLPLVEDNDEFESIILDCTDLEYIASSGLRLFFAIVKNAKENGSRVIIRNPKDFVTNVLNMTGMSSMFEFE